MRLILLLSLSLGQGAAFSSPTATIGCSGGHHLVTNNQRRIPSQIIAKSSTYLFYRETVDRDGSAGVTISAIYPPPEYDTECWVDSVQTHRRCQHPSLPVEELFHNIKTAIGRRKETIKEKGVPFALAYSMISNLNGAIGLSVAWYMTVKKTGLSPLVPGQNKLLLSSYAMIYAANQVLKPVRIIAAVALSKLSAEYIVRTQECLNCSRNVAIGCQYMVGQLMMALTFGLGVSIVHLLTGVPIFPTV